MFMATLNILLYSLFQDKTLSKFTFTGANMYTRFLNKFVSYSLSGAAMEKIGMQRNRKTLILYICFVFYAYDVKYVLLLFTEQHIHSKERIS